MKREIKFRAWDEETKIMREVTNLNFFDELVYCDETNDSRTAVRRKIGQVVLMQYTGLVDKNGKEIYEGDVVSYPDTETTTVDVGVGEVPVAQYPINTFGQVVFSNGVFGTKIEDGELLNGWFDIATLVEETMHNSLVTLEVIGNIYENPELLNA